MSPDIDIYVALTSAELGAMFTPAATAALESMGRVVHGPDGGTVPVPPDVAERFDVLVTAWSSRFDPASLDGRRLRLAAHAPASVRALYPAEVLGRRLRVVQCGADAMALPVAEMALTMALALLRNLHSHDRRLQATRDWTLGGHGELGRAVHVQRHGIIGLSRTGRHYVRMLRGLGATQVSAYDPYVGEAEAARLGVRLTELDELVATSDVLAVHAPATPRTAGMVGRAQLAALPDGAVLVNTARSALVDQVALLDELRSGRISAGLDVFDEEPLPAGSPFFGLPNVLLTPHVAGGTPTARTEQGDTVVAEIGRFLSGQPLAHEVTPEVYDRLA